MKNSSLCLACFESEIETFASMAKKELERMQGRPLNDDSCKNMSSTASRATAATAAPREDVRAEKRRNSSYYQKKSDIVSGYKADVICRVEGCSATCESNYESRVRACSEHLKAERVDIEQQIYRFCQKCTKFEDVKCFDGMKRACRASLAKLASKRKTEKSKDVGSRTLLSTATTATAAATSSKKAKINTDTNSDSNIDFVVVEDNSNSSSQETNTDEEKLKNEIAEQLVNIIALDNLRRIQNKDEKILRRKTPGSNDDSAREKSAKK